MFVFVVKEFRIKKIPNQMDDKKYNLECETLIHTMWPNLYDKEAM